MRISRSIIGACLALLAWAPAANAQANAASNAQLRSKWLALVDAHKFDEAAAMMTGDATYRNDDGKQTFSSPRRIFVEWITHCEKRAAYQMPTSSSGEVTSAFHLVCEKYNKDGTFTPGFTEALGFFVSANASGIRIW